ncbi:unnamed protein product [Miscanthus lutarioriparius]|uniref:Uncharacterized protein n=1 Tax=Miscanthus lutarioriparius TaxID=422564 RepID=A0A811QEM4_9POAL|nr:unnamed protein product [Miscanthus lutarioriparius]
MTGAGAAPRLPTERDAEHHQRSITPFVLCENTQSLVYFYSGLSCNGLDLDGFAWSMGTPDPLGAMVERLDPWCTSSATVPGMAQEMCDLKFNGIRNLVYQNGSKASTCVLYYVTSTAAALKQS